MLFLAEKITWVFLGRFISTEHIICECISLYTITIKAVFISTSLETERLSLKFYIHISSAIDIHISATQT